MQIASTEYLVTDSLIPDATAKARFRAIRQRRDVLPPLMLQRRGLRRVS